MIECFDELVIELEVGNGNGIIRDNGKTSDGIISRKTFSGSRTRSLVENIREIEEVGGYHINMERPINNCFQGVAKEE